MMDEKVFTNQQLQVLSAIVGRAALAARMGTQFNGERDLYEVLGYEREIHAEQYFEKYHRQDIAGKIVDLPAQDTWRRPPIIEDGEEDTSMADVKSPFLQGIKFLVEKRRLWHFLQRADRLAGISRYGVLLIGTSGTDSLSKPLEGGLSDAADVIYLSPFTESSAAVQSLVTDPGNPRYRLPEMYSIRMGEGFPTETVHWSRVIHIAEDLEEDEIYGRPRLERVYNRLDDLMKIVGGGSEANWLNVNRGLHADVRDDFDLDPSQEAALSDEIAEYVHGLRRVIRTRGVDIEPLGTDVVDPSGIFGSVISLISAASDIPQRILLGSERGELASSQDMATWAGAIASRQTQHAEPAILRPFIDRLIQAGALPAPSAGKYEVEWPSLFEMSDMDRATLADKVASAVAKIAPAGAADLVITPDEFRERVMKWPARDKSEAALLDDEDATTEDDLSDEPSV